VSERNSGSTTRNVVLELDGLQWATEKNAVEATLGRRAGVVGVTANPVAQTATVTYDPTQTTVEDLTGWIRNCGYHCRGESVPDHLCPSTVIPTASRPPARSTSSEHGHTGHTEHNRTAIRGRGGSPTGSEKMSGYDMAVMQTMESPSTTSGSPTSSNGQTGHDIAAIGGEDRMGSPSEVMGHGGHGEMSMASMIRDMRNRFLVAVVLGVVITLWSRIGRDVLGFTVPAPFGLRDS